ncbi:MAG: hypothetical protein Q9227_003412 [Pyrenula ochraceoflavens]
MFVFGDSYTTTSFLPNGTQPNPSNPLGNPPYPGYTSSDGPNWIDYMTETFNTSYIQTYNLAYGGATVDSSLVAQYLPTVLDMQQQVNQEFLPDYSSQSSTTPPWSSHDTLFIIWIGINDIGNSYGAQNSSLNSIIFSELSDLVSEMYNSGARNFLFLNVPPVDRSPLTTAQGPASSALEKSDIADWNSRLTSYTTRLRQQHRDSTVFLFDTNALFNTVLDDPRRFAETAGYKNTTGYCEAYMNGTPNGTTFDGSCAYPVDEYFWLNSLHPTFPMHRLLAREVVGELEGRR